MSNHISGWIRKSIRNIKSSTKQGIHATVIVSLTFASTFGMAIPTMVSAGNHGNQSGPPEINIENIELTPNPVESGGTVNAEIEVSLEGSAQWRSISGSHIVCDSDFVPTESDDNLTATVTFNAPVNDTDENETHIIDFTVHHSNGCDSGEHTDSDSRSLTVLPASGSQDDPDPAPLNAPNLISPEEGVVLQSDDLPKQQTWEGVEGANGYYYESCEIDPGAGVCGNIVHDQTINNGTSRNIGTTAPEGTFWWRVAALDSDGNQGPWSETRQFTIDYFADQQIQLTAPFDGAYVNQELLRDPLTANQWEELDGAVYYIYQSFDSQDDIDSEDTRWESGELTTTYKAIGQNDQVANATIYWRVKAVNENGISSQWSDAWELNIDSTSPAVPMNLRATNPELNCGETTDSFDVTVAWDASTDNYDVSHYEYWIVTPERDEDSAWTTPVFGTHRTGEFNEGEGEYTIKVRAIDQAGNESEWSDDCTFEYVTSTTNDEEDQTGQEQETNNDDETSTGGGTNNTITPPGLIGTTGGGTTGTTGTGALLPQNLAFLAGPGFTAFTDTESDATEDEGDVLAEEDEDDAGQSGFTTANDDEGEVESESIVANLFNWWWILLLLIIGALGYFLYSRRSSDRS